MLESIAPITDAANKETSHWIKNFPDLNKLDPCTRQRLLQSVKAVRLPAQTVAFYQGKDVCSYPFVYEGCIRMRRISRAGREITLYRIKSGQTCTLATASLLGGGPLPAEGITESDTCFMALSVVEFQNLIVTSKGFLQFIFSSHADTLNNLIGLVQEVAFKQMDARLADKLLQQMNLDERLTITHQELAAQLGSVREVVSRRLKRFEQQGWLSLTRGAIDILNVKALSSLASRVA